MSEPIDETGTQRRGVPRGVRRVRGEGSARRVLRRADAEHNIRVARPEHVEVNLRKIGSKTEDGGKGGVSGGLAGGRWGLCGASHHNTSSNEWCVGGLARLDRVLSFHLVHLWRKVRGNRREHAHVTGRGRGSGVIF